MNSQAILIKAHCLEALSSIPDQYIHTVITSPPYWGLRNYGADDQIGNEETIQEYIESLTTIFSEVHRVLRDDGTLWLNLGDVYAANRSYQVADNKWSEVGNSRGMQVPLGLKAKELIGLPWRVAFALQAYGWYLRSDIIWAKTNPMPESVKDRPTRSHEYIFLLTKKPHYFYDADAVREPHTSSRKGKRSSYAPGSASTISDGKHLKKSDAGLPINTLGRNKRDVWTISTSSFKGAHFAVFPEKLIEPCVLAGTSEHGCCGECGAPYKRIVERKSLNRNELPLDHPEFRPSRYDNGKAGDPQMPGPGQRYSQVSHQGWEKTCEHQADISPCFVLDPFNGSGTTGLVSLKNGRSFIGIDVNSDYVEMARMRLSQVAPVEVWGL